MNLGSLGEDGSLPPGLHGVVMFQLDSEAGVWGGDTEAEKRCRGKSRWHVPGKGRQPR